MSRKEAYEQKLQAQLDQWSAEIDKLKARADKASAEAKLSYYDQIDELRRHRDAARAKLAELKTAGDEAWDELRGGVERAWESLGSAVRAAASRFK